MLATQTHEHTISKEKVHKKRKKKRKFDKNEK